MIYDYGIPDFIPIRGLDDLREQLPSIFNNSLSDAQRLVSVINCVNRMGLIVGEIADNWSEVEHWVKTNGVENATRSVLHQFVEDGTLEKIINETALAEINGNVEKLRSELETAEKNLNDKMSALEERLNNANVDLKKYVIDEINNAIATINNSNAQLWNKVKQEIANVMTNGGITEVFKTLAELKEKYPNGKEGIFLVTENQHLYYWNTSAWADAGAYMQAELTDESVTSEKIAVNARQGYIMCGKPVNLDTTNHTITIDNIWYITAGNEVLARASDYPSPVKITFEGSSGFLTYSKINKKFEISEYPTIPKDNVYLGMVSLAGHTVFNFNAPQTTINNSMNYYPSITHHVFIASQDPFNIDVETKTLEIPSGYKNLIDNGSYAVHLGNDSGTFNLNVNDNATYLYYDPLAKRFVGFGNVYNHNDMLFYIGYISWETPTPKINLNMRYTVNGETDVISPADRNFSIASGKPFILDLNAKTLTVPDQYINIITNKGINSFTKHAGEIINLEPESGSATWVYYNQVEDKIIGTNVASFNNNHDILIGWVSWTDVVPHYHFDFDVVTSPNSNGKMDDSGGNFVGFGDSITWSYNPTKWVSIVGHDLKMKQYINNGIPGSRMAVSDSRTDSAVERVDKIRGDTIVVWFGINDFHAGTPIGEFQNNDNKTFYGACDSVFKTLINNNPSATIIVLTPMKQHGYNTAPDSFTKNSQDLYQLDYVNALKKVADYYCLPVLDMYTDSGITAFNDTQSKLYLRDGLHPSQLGEYRVAKRITKFIKSQGV